MKNYDNSTASGSQIVDLLKTLKEEDGVTIVVSNGYIMKNKSETVKPREYTYESLHENDGKELKEIINKKNLYQYINPNASFNSSVTYDDNREISSVRFEQK